METLFNSVVAFAKTIKTKMVAAVRWVKNTLTDLIQKKRKSTNAKSEQPTNVVSMAKPASMTSTACASVSRHTANSSSLRTQLRALVTDIAAAEDRAFKTTSFIVVVHEDGFAMCTEMAMTDSDKLRTFGRDAQGITIFHGSSSPSKKLERLNDE